MVELPGNSDRDLEKRNDPNWEPLEVFENIDFNPSRSRYPTLFASQAEVDGFLSGSEHWTLCSSGESMYSASFVQCAGALVRNRQTGITTLIHESMWSASATVALGIQKHEDLDIITIAGPIGGMRFKDLKYFHEKDSRETIELIDTIDDAASVRYGMYYPGKEFLANFFWDRSKLLGLSKEDLQRSVLQLTTNPHMGETNHIGDIRLPVSRGEANRWYLLYRPEENIIWIYESGTRKLFKYPGFDIPNSQTY